MTQLPSAKDDGVSMGMTPPEAPLVITQSPSAPTEVTIDLIDRESHQQRLSSALSTLPKQKEDDVSCSASTAIVPVFSNNNDDDDNDNQENGWPYGGKANKYQRPRNPFTGLSNQGATCYMNSLLQTLYMTPEFRQGLYRWQFRSEDGEEDNIPLQLQMLFAKLQMTTQESISTKALTKSFGWTGADVFQQHDVQELCRVLFDALEREFKGTVNETLVNDLYQGALKDYVKCRECGYESSRIDNFLDLSLVIRPFGSDRMMQSVEEAIEFFLKPEVLDKENQWMCDQCKVKRDAVKGLKFSKLPYLLSLQLKRFDFDYMTMNRIKLHNEVTFPKYLDMNSYVGGGDEQSETKKGAIARKMSMERHELEQASKKSERSPIQRLPSMDEGDELSELSLNASSVEEDEKMEDKPDTWSAIFDPEEMIESNGPHVYELFSVLIHSGSALGGHYYAYIKSLEDGQWFNFNDSNVSRISDEELKTAFGGGGGSNPYSVRMSYSTCAYMLMYRLVSKDKNVQTIPDSMIPSYLKERIDAEEERLRKAEQERIEMAKKVQLKIFMKGKKAVNANKSNSNHNDRLEKSMHLYKTCSVREAMETICTEFAKDPAAILPPQDKWHSNVRLRHYNEYTGYAQQALDGDEDKQLRERGLNTGSQLFVEVKSNHEEWESYDPTKLQLFVRRFCEKSENGDLSVSWHDALVRCIQIDDEAALSTLCDVIRNRFAIPPTKKIRLLKKAGLSYSSTPVTVLNKTDDANTMNRKLRAGLGLTNGNDLYFEECMDLALPSPAEAHFEREANMITVNFKYLTHGPRPIRIDRRETVRKLKEKISAIIDLPANRFKLLRGINSSGIEIKAIDVTLYKLSIGSNHTVFVLEGTPLNIGEYNFRLVLHQPRTLEPPRSDEPRPLVYNEVYCALNSQDDAEFSFVSNIIVSEEMAVDEIRRRAWQALVDKDHIDAATTSKDQIRLRDMHHHRMSRILVSDGAGSRRLNEASDVAAYEGRTLVAQILRAPQTDTSLDMNHRVVEFVVLHRGIHRFTHRFEAVIANDAAKLHPTTYLKHAVEDALRIPRENEHDLRFARLPTYRDGMDVLEAMAMDVSAADAFANEDHEYHATFLVVDANVQAEPISEEETKAIRDFLTKQNAKSSAEPSAASVATSSASTYRYQKPKEAALVIRTKASSRSATSDQGSTNTRPDGTSSCNGLSIRTPTHKTAQHQSDTDEDDDDVHAHDSDVAMDVDDMDDQYQIVNQEDTDDDVVDLFKC